MEDLYKERRLSGFFVTPITYPPLHGVGVACDVIGDSQS